MKLFTGWAISAGLVFAAVSANAQGAPQTSGRSGYEAASDFSGPYGAVPPNAPVQGPPVHGQGPILLPPQEVYSVLRENGFLPLGIPRLHGFFYTIAVIDRRGEDGRLVIDARDGQIVRFVPVYGMGGNFNGGMAAPYPPAGRLPPVGELRGPPQPPDPVPKLASRTPAVPIPRATPPRPASDKPIAEKPQPSQQSVAVVAKPAEAPVTPPARVVAAKPAPQILPTQPMPQVQGLD
ncbi:MAG TPA: hypothetical protein VKS24_16735 [Bradyrhizobium sp.]|nr:hypothetical protein [Bradyrhizobium sp.]